MCTLGMAACYSPDPDAPFGFALPFDMETGEIVPDVWARWKEFDPAEMVLQPKYQEALRGLRCLFLDCGSRDEWHLHLGMRLLVKRLEEAGIATRRRGVPRHASIDQLSLRGFAAAADAGAGTGGGMTAGPSGESTRYV